MNLDFDSIAFTTGPSSGFWTVFDYIMEEETIEILPSTRYCFVPSCGNNSVKNRDLAFVAVKNQLKEDWCRLLNRKYTKRQLYCCEIHLDLKKDLENYEKWQREGGYPIMSKNATLKRIPSTVIPSTSSESTAKFQVVMIDKIIQVKPTTADKSTNKTDKPKNPLPKHYHEKVESDEISHFPSPSGSSYCPSEITESSTSAFASKSLTGRFFILDLIKKNPMMYLGIPKNYYWLIDHIVKENQYKTNSLNIIITLFKLRQSDTLARIGHQFQISETRLRKIFYETTLTLSSYFQNFIVSPSAFSIKDNLPFSFKINYSNVVMIIDCFEIGIQKPSNPVRQAQTWSAYKSCNTIKYLVGAAPSGLITFVSKGYGGRITDTKLTIESGLIDILPTNSVIMADRGFKEIESHLATKNIKLVRPPSVYSNIKPTKEQVIESKKIASLRIHIERVIRRLREFKILKPHSLINHLHVPYLDEFVIIACGLSNIQTPIIKQE